MRAVLILTTLLVATGATAAEVAVRTGAAAFGDWRADAPGVRRHIRAADLPKPGPSSAGPPTLVGRPATAALAVPPGFKVTAFLAGLTNPRMVRTAPNGDLFVAETSAGRIRVIRPSQDGRSAAEVQVFATGLDQPFGMAFYPQGADPQWLYVANVNSVVRFAYRSGDLQARSAPQQLVGQLSGSTRGHSTRDLVFSADGRRMLVSVGSESNAAESMSRKSVAQAKAYETTAGLGASWDDEAQRADVLAFDPEGQPEGKPFATGIRNCVGLAVHPQTGDIWCSTNERDGLGDNLVPDYVTRVRQGAFYGWPWYYIGNHHDPRLAGQRPDLARKVTVPDVLLLPHSASLGLTVYRGTSGTPSFPADYNGDGFAALHG